jgi:branched-chain amino acid transport system ATP-binding protein
MSEVVPILAIADLHAWYGESKVLHGVDFALAKGEVATLLGRNGAGKTTTIKSIMGLMSRRRGSIRHGGAELIASPPERIARQGIGYCPEERGIFASLDVEENLLLPPVVRPGGLSLDEVYDLFPALRERRRSQGTKLSGGEQQMLALGRLLRTGADVLLLDEPTEGLAPVIVRQIAGIIRELKTRGFTLLVVAQDFHFAVGIADRHFIMENGRIVDSLSAAELEADMGRVHAYLGV